MSTLILSVVVVSIGLLALVVIFSGDSSPWTCHSRPDHSLTCAEAHQVLQERKECSRVICDLKWAAWFTLVEAGKITPAEQMGVAR